MPARCRAPQRFSAHRLSAARRLPLALRRSAAGGAFAVLAMSSVLSGTLLGGSASAATADPDFELPFSCGEEWAAGTRSGHSPSYWSVDFNAYDDFGHPVLASAPGVVTAAVDLGDTSYGRYVVVDHGDGWTTLYAHLEQMLVQPGQWLDQGQMVGLLGTSGGSSGPHLHFEERLNRLGQRAVFHDEPLIYNTTVSSRSCPDVPVSGDWNGNGVTDLATWRRSAGAGKLSLRGPDGAETKVAWGRTIDEPVAGDWDGDGTSNVGVWQRLTRTFVLRTAAGGAREVAFGSRRSAPVTGDWDGDGRDEVGVFNPRLGRFSLRMRSGEPVRVVLGDIGSLPVTGDWNGDGSTEVGVYDPMTGEWRLRHGNGSVTTTSLGGAGRLPVTGNWDGDDATELGTWSPVTARFTLRLGPNSIRTVDWGHRRH